MFQDRLGELKALITIRLRQESFCQEIFQRDCSYLDAFHASFSYEEIVPVEVLIETENWEVTVANAYDTFQRIALALEVVKEDLVYHEGMGMKVSAGMKRLLRIVEGQMEGVLVSLLTELEMKGISGPTLSMTVLPPSIRCLDHSVMGNHRDFVILRHVLHAASFFSVTLNQS